VARNNKGRRCTRVPAADSVLCRIHERAPSTKAEYFEECRTFLQDVFDAGRRADRDVLVALLVMAFEDDSIRKEFLAIVAGDARRAKSASARPPHPVAQNRNSRPERKGSYQTPKADPPPAPEIEDDGIDWHIVEEMDQ
jgi:hypothetical protein